MQPISKATEVVGQPCATGPAFPITVKALATTLVVSLGYWGWKASDKLISARLPMSSIVFLMSALIILLLCYIAMLYSRTSVTQTHLQQTWLWKKQVALADITQVKFIQVPGFAWLITPRLVVRVGNRGLYTFPVADAYVERIFSRMAGSARIPHKER